MFKLLSVLALSFTCATGFSKPTISPVEIHKSLLPAFAKGLINWKVGQKMGHNIALMGMQGTMDTVVAEETAKGFWLKQAIAISGMNQTIETLISKEDGTVLEMKVNGQKQTPPAPPEIEVEEQRQENVTVPAGAFDTMYVKIKDLKTNEPSEIWINQQLVPINGMVKMSATSSGYKVDAELTSYKM